MLTNLRISESDWTRIRDHCQSSFRSPDAHETGLLAVLGENTTSAKHEFFVARLLVPGKGDLKVTGAGYLEFDATYLRRAHLLMRCEKLAGIMTVHTHPQSTNYVSFSLFDDEQDPLLLENLQELHAGTRLLSVVLGKNSVCARTWVSPKECEPMGKLEIVGEGLAELPLNGEPAHPTPHPSAIFDRAMSLTNSGALTRLKGMTVAVVGASGTGSIVPELLLRAGCERIMSIDDDLMGVENGNRVLHSEALDIAKRTPKVLIIKRNIKRLGFDCRVEAIQGTMLDQTVLARLQEADVIFGCIDKALPRKLLSQFAFQYLRPYIDVGTEIGGDDNGIISVDTRVNYVAPGRHCLMCTGLVTPRQLAFESSTGAERERVIKLGYSDDLILKQPAVMELNMRAAAAGMLVLRHLLQPFMRIPLPVTLTENLVMLTMRCAEKPRIQNPKCPICQRNSAFGYGDCGPVLGFESTTVARLKCA